ncbi:hypothetical protein [Paenibacillus arenosi]|uniref:Uncharacterized protein n=1 Tax=Paenibacillus arenosi TaxID=2774142 RepID=A0ABR9AWK0_9BACL|nr:hypothetical protein [Paenibacillus arenosi]MBD8498468.1 hypothetical protein [Paenibacillus arenosi]
MAGFLADYLFNPLLQEGGLLASTVGEYIGTGPTRGIGLLFIVAGIFTVIIAAITSKIKSILELKHGRSSHSM